MQGCACDGEPVKVACQETSLSVLVATPTAILWMSKFVSIHNPQETCSLSCGGDSVFTKHVENGQQYKENRTKHSNVTADKLPS